MRSSSLKIFLVENHGDTRTYLVAYLESCGHEVQTATSMTAALEILASARVDVLLCDIRLPDGDGWQLMRRMGEISDPPPFGIAMSGFGSDADRERSRAAGYRHHLVKPFLPEDLDVLITEAATLWEEKI